MRAAGPDYRRARRGRAARDANAAEIGIQAAGLNGPGLCESGDRKEKQEKNGAHEARLYNGLSEVRGEMKREWGSSNSESRNQ